MRARETYVVAAFSIHQRKAVLYSEYASMTGVLNGVKKAFMEKDSDYISLRRIRPEAR